MKKYSESIAKINESVVLGKELPYEAAHEVIGFLTFSNKDFYPWYESIGKKIGNIQVFVKGDGKKTHYFVKDKNSESVQFEFVVTYVK